MIVFPNAKINIGLNIVKKRNDGLHNIESIFYPIFDLYDVLEILESKQLEFIASGIKIPGNSASNLCVKAFHLLKKNYNIPYVKIHLHKVIPIGAGLGGGSSDASFMLKALVELFDLKLTDEQLINYAKKLGSDCAFFIKNKPVYAFNKGDDFEELELDLSSYQIKLEYPNIHIGTAEAYSNIVPKQTKLNLQEAINQPVTEWKELIKNDFEVSVFLQHPEVKKLKNKMYKDGAIYTSMTGSGSAVYGVFTKEL